MTEYDSDKGALEAYAMPMTWRMLNQCAQQINTVLGIIKKSIDREADAAKRMNELVEHINLMEARLAMLELDVKIGDEREF